MVDLCSNILSTSAEILGAIGTIYAVWGILKMNFKDMRETMTAGYIRNGGKKYLPEKYYAIGGTVFIVLASVVGLIEIWWEGISLRWTIAVVLTAAAIAIFVFFALKSKLKKAEIRYDEYMKKHP